MTNNSMENNGQAYKGFNDLKVAKATNATHAGILASQSTTPSPLPTPVMSGPTKGTPAIGNNQKKQAMVDLSTKVRLR